MNLNGWRDEIHRLACEKGWHDGPHNVFERMALIHSEVSEAVEDARLINDVRDYADISYDEKGKPIGFAVEMADVIIRVLDECGRLGIDIERAIEIKHAFNQTRAWRHGGKRA